MESSIRPSFLRKNRRIRKGLFTANHESCGKPASHDKPAGHRPFVNFLTAH